MLPMDADPEIVGKNLEALTARLGLDKLSLARAVNRTERVVHAWMNEYQPRDLVRVLSKALVISEDDLLADLQGQKAYQPSPAEVQKWRRWTEGVDTGPMAPTVVEAVEILLDTPLRERRLAMLSVPPDRIKSLRSELDEILRLQPFFAGGSEPIPVGDPGSLRREHESKGGGKPRGKKSVRQDH